jgi:hypothetical protein
VQAETVRAPSADVLWAVALDGTLRVMSPRDEGTVVTAELPCAR